MALVGEAQVAVEEGITAARLDRELNELLQELRAEQNGILLLVGFLLVVPVQHGPAGDDERGLRDRGVCAVVGPPARVAQINLR